MTSTLTTRYLKGHDILPYIDDLAKLRITVFKEYPYLYLGNMQYETQYLQTYINCPESFMVLVFNHATIVGASTAIPLEFELIEFQKPFHEHDFKVPEIFYLGESVLLPEFRGHKLYRKFFTAREQAARGYGSNMTAFCCVVRDSDDPKRPIDYQPLDPIWQHFGYVKHPELHTAFEWQEIGENTASLKPMIFWLKTLAIGP